MRLKRMMAALAVVVIGTAGALVVATPASAGTNLYYQSVDSDNDPYSGIYLRNGTSMGNVDRVWHRYMYYGNRFELICGAWGESVGPRANRRWHQVYVMEGPAVGQTGWIADRYTSTPNAANQPTPGEPECGAGLARRGAVYYSPYPQGQYVPNTWAAVMPYSAWTSPTQCSTTNIGNTPGWEPNTGRTVTTLAGWSIGRLGPLYYLDRFRDRWQTIDTIIMIDPGTFHELTTSCDVRINGGVRAQDLLFDWLNANPRARLIIYAGAVTEDHPSMTGNHAHRGIQEVYFPRIRSTHDTFKRRVMVCNYQLGQNATKATHDAMLWGMAGLIDKEPPTTSYCPNGGQYWFP